MRKQWAIIGGVLILGTSLIVLASPGDANAGPVEDAIAGAREDVRQGRCDQAYQRLASIGGLEVRAKLLAGECRIRAKLYPEALSDLDQIRGDQSLNSEQIGDVELYRGIALYHLERYADSSTAIDAANGLTRQDAQLSLYRGLIALRKGDNDLAAPALESAARLSPQLSEPVASYYAGLAWQGASERTKARDAFKRVIALDPDGPWGKEAQKLLDSTDLFPFYVRGSIGFEFDDNVLLRGDVTRSNQNRLSGKDQEDWRGVWEIEGGVQLFSAGDLSGGLNASYSGNAQHDLGELDIHYPTVGAYLAHQFGPNTYGQARYRLGLAWVDTDPYLLTQAGELSLAHTWATAGTTVAMVDFTGNDLRFRPDDVADGDGPGGAPFCSGATQNPTFPSCSPPGVNERRERKRDGFEFGVAVEHSIVLPVPDVMNKVVRQIEVGGGYRFNYLDSRGEEWEHFGHLFSGGVNVEFPLDFSMASRLSYQYRDFLHRSTFPDSEVSDEEYTLSPNDRREHEVIVEVEVEKDITKNVSVSTRYSYLTNNSNRDAYNYNRHIVGGYLDFRFD